MNASTFQQLLHLTDSRTLTEEEAARAMQIIMGGGATPAQTAAWLVLLRQRGETVAELTGAVKVMRSKAAHFPGVEGAIDTCGTGGDGTGSYNISTAVAIVTASCGVPVVKHGNRSVSSRSGSADVLQALDVNVNMEQVLAERALKQAGLCFLMAPHYHTAMRHVAPVRQELGMRTLFNLLGPLANPATPDYQLLGVFSRQWVRPMAEVLQRLGIQRAWVVHGSDGMDELTTTGISHVAAVEGDGIREFMLHPVEAGIQCVAPEALRGGDAAHNAKAIRHVLDGQPGALRDIVVYNAAAALVIAGKAGSIRQGVETAATAIDDGKAKETLALLGAISHSEPPAHA